MPVKAVKNVLKAIESFKDREDGTYEFETGNNVEYSAGYQVSFVRPEAFEQLSSEDWDGLTNFCCTYLDSPPYIGVYMGGPEVSFHVTSLEKAVKIANKFNQESILVWSKKQAEQGSDDGCLIINKKFDMNKVIEYGKILKEIL